MNVQPKQLSAMPTGLASSISWANREEELPVLSLVAAPWNAVSDSTECEDDADVEVARTNDSSGVVAKTTVGEQARLDAWLKFYTPARSINVSGKKKYVQQVLPDGSTVEVALRRRNKGKLPHRLLAAGDHGSSTTVQVVPFSNLGERVDRSEAQRDVSGANGSNKLVSFPTYEAADAAVMQSFIYEAAYSQMIDSCLAKSRARAVLDHAKWQEDSGGSSTADRYLSMICDDNLPATSEAPKADIVMSAANDEDTQWEISRRNAIADGKAEADRYLEKCYTVERARYQRALKKGTMLNGHIPNSRRLNRTTTNGVAVNRNAASLLSSANPNMGSDERTYKRWLEDRDTYNPIIDSSRISITNKWSSLMSLHGKEREVVRSMKRLNDERTAYRMLVAPAETAKHDQHVKQRPVSAIVMAEQTGAATLVTSTSVLAKAGAPVDEALHRQRMMDAIHSSPLAVKVNGRWMTVTKQMVAEALHAMESEQAA